MGKRYLPPAHLSRTLETIPGLEVHPCGTSVEGRPILVTELGSGPIRVLMWSQMHGNEATTTRAVADLLHLLMGNDPISQDLRQALTIRILPQLNPDGAKSYTRENAAGVDLNRDARLLTQPESKVLREQYLEFRPRFCFNLHDQRTIYNVGNTPVPATLSFLSPAQDPERTLTSNRKEAMQLIACIASDLQAELPGGIGRYDDSFNADCTGDQFQMAGTPTVLFEAGHFPGDYQREETRAFVFKALLSALQHIARGSHRKVQPEGYLQIPENGKDFTDLHVLSAHLLDPRYSGELPLAIQYREVLRKGRIFFQPQWPEEGLGSCTYAHECLDLSTPAGMQAVRSREALYHFLLSE
ncbi:M14 family zinc carboxypeptidase [Robiginitalea sediminis]|uniref:M14 family zinc carboxypeptidase n=1 Tax=Robiginitalea sediminis TaxID=1982593 RepID=UPI001303A323|nr:M14 family zinc carboxypeptidase [Robiginitalea sediminis]